MPAMNALAKTTRIAKATALCLLLLAEESNAFLSQSPFTTQTTCRSEFIARLPSSFSGHTMKNSVKGPSSENTEPAKEESDRPFVMQPLKVKGPLENATFQGKTLNNSAREESDPDSLKANESAKAINVAAFEATESEHSDTESNIVTIAEDAEQANGALPAVENAQGHDLSDVEDSHETDETQTKKSENSELWTQAKAIATPFYEYIKADPNRSERASDRERVGALFQEFFPHDNTRLEALVMLTLRQSKLIRTKRYGNKVIVSFAQSAPGDFSFGREHQDVRERKEETIKEGMVASEDDPKLSSFDSVQLEEESSSFVEAKETLVDRSFDAAKVDSASKNASRPSSGFRDKTEAETAPTLEMKNMSMNVVKLGEASHVLLTPAMETFGDSPEPLFEYPQNELEGSSPPIMEGKGTLKDDLSIDSDDTVDAQCETAVEEMPEQAWEVPFETKDESEKEATAKAKEATALIEKAEASESAVPVVVLESESLKDQEQPEKESLELKVEAGFFFGKKMSNLDESTVIQRMRERKEARQEREANKNNEELSLLEHLQTANVELNDVKRQFDLDMEEMRAEAKIRQAQLRERLNDMTVRAEIAEDLNKQTQSKMQKMMGRQFDFEVEAKEWKDRYARDSPLWTNLFERERVYRRQEQIEARERLVKFQADARETVRLAKEEGRHKLEAIKLDLSHQLEQKDSQLLERDIKLKQLQKAIEASDARIAELECQRSVRQLLGEAWAVFKGRVQKKWVKGDERKTTSVK